MTTYADKFIPPPKTKANPIQAAGTMPIEVQVNASNRIKVATWHDGSVDLTYLVKPTPESDYQFNGGIVIDRGSALTLAICILEKSGHADVLIKKYRPEVD